VRLIAATNREPQRAVDEGKLREDLFYRLNVFPIQLPPLRARREDITLLAEHFLQAIGRQEGVTKRASRDTLAQWNAYAWPGNVRELRNIVHRAYVMARGSEIEDPCLPVQMEPPEPALLPAGAKTPTLWVQVGMRWDEIERQVHAGHARAFRRASPAHLRRARHQRQDALQLAARLVADQRPPASPAQLCGAGAHVVAASPAAAA
jgi:DNA-binding NtrC family response regulator